MANLSNAQRADSKGPHILFCTKCRVRMETIDSRPTMKTQAIRRRRACPKCGRRITTWETLSPPRRMREVIRYRIKKLLREVDLLLAFSDKPLSARRKG